MPMQRPRRISQAVPLGSNGVYTSPGINGEKYGRFTGKVFSDQGGTIEFQHADDDGTGKEPSSGWDTLTTTTVTGGTALKFDETIYCKWIRVKYTNGATAQTSFRLSGYLGPRGD